MLLQRVITAVVLLAVLVPALFASSPTPFAALVLVLIGAAAWEWARLTGFVGWSALFFGAGVLVACGCAWWSGWVDRPPVLLWWLASAAWVLGGAVVLRSGVAGWLRWPKVLKLALGAAILFMAWLALAAARERGLAFILSVFCLVWVADVSAYVGGKLFGRRKLAPTISPGKSWEGVVSGVLGVMLLGAAWLGWELSSTAAAAGGSRSLFWELDHQWGHLGLVLMAVGLCAMSVVGDLTESLIKRAAGAKDSSSLLPGHGGVLDRVDALLPVFPLAMAFVAV
jgi:phosphatidate cytidylyltransferase